MGLRIKAEFKSDQDNDYIVEIHDTNYTSTTREMTIGPGGFTIDWQGETDEIYSPIISSSLTFSLYDRGESWLDTFFDAFKQYQEKRFYVVVKKNTNIFWFGWIVQDLIEIEDVSNPTLYQFQAVDGISKMASTPYEYDGVTRTITDTIYNIISDNTPIAELTQTDVLLRTISNYWSEEQTYSDTTDPLSITRFPAKTFAEYTDIGTIEYSTGLDIIRELCLVFGCRFYFDNGQFRFEQFSLRNGNELREFKYLMNGTADGYDDTNVDFDVDQSTRYRSQGTFRYLPAINKIQLTDIKKANVNIIGGSVTYDSGFGDEINVGVIPSADNGRIYLEMISRFETYISTPTSGSAVPVFAVTIRLEPTDGSANQYWSNALVSGVTSFGAGSWSTALGTYKWAANSVTRSQNTITTTAHTMVTGPLPKDGEIFLDVTILGFYDASGSSTSFFIGDNSYDWAVTINKARFENDNSPASIASVIGFATNPSNKIKSNLTLDLGEVRLYNGSGELGSLYVYDGANWVPSGGWRVGNSGTYRNTSLLVTSDLMQFHNNPIQRWEGTMIYNENFFSLLLFDSKEWIGMRATFNANMDELNGEWFYINDDATNVTIGTPIDVVDTDFGNTDAPDAVGHYANISIGDIGGMNIDKDNTSIGPYQETETGGQINGTAVVTGNATLEAGLDHQGFLIEEITDVTHQDGATYTIAADDYMIFNTWKSGAANGTATINLPNAQDNEGRLLRFKSDATISANTSITLTPVTGQTIDGNNEFAFNRDYDGVMLLAHNSNWYIIQRKAK